MEQSQISKSILEAINSNIENLNSTQLKVSQALAEAEKTFDEVRRNNKAKRLAIQAAIQDLNKNLGEMLEKEKERAEESYNNKLIQLGLKSEDHPFDVLSKKADEVITVPIAGIGRAARSFMNLYDGVKDRFNVGFKA